MTVSESVRTRSRGERNEKHGRQTIYASVLYVIFQYLVTILETSFLTVAKVTFYSSRPTSRVARSPVFYGISRISDPFSRLPGEAAGKNKSPVFC